MAQSDAEMNDWITSIKSAIEERGEQTKMAQASSNSVNAASVNGGSINGKEPPSVRINHSE